MPDLYVRTVPKEVMYNAKLAAAIRGVSLKQFLIEALQQSSECVLQELKLGGELGKIKKELDWIDSTSKQAKLGKRSNEDRTKEMDELKSVLGVVS